MKSVEYFSCKSDVTIHVEEDQRIQVFVNDQPVSVSTEQSEILDYLLLRHPEASVDEIQTYLMARKATMISEAQVRSRLGELCERDLVLRQNRPARLNIPHKLDHTCEMCGCSCLAQLVGPLNEHELNNVTTAHAELHAEHQVPQGVNPIMKGLKPDGTCMHFLNFPGKRCLFLGDDNLCKLHARYGAMQKPAACRRFPHIAIATESEIRVGIKPYCYANARVCRIEPADGAYIDQFKAENAEFFDNLVESASMRPILRNVSPLEAAQAKLQEVQILDWLEDADMPWSHFMARLIEEPKRPLEKLPKAFVTELGKRFKAFAPALRAEVAKLGDTTHAKHCAALCDQLEKPLTRTPDQASADFMKFARYSLFNAVFLRETSRFPSLSLGTFALSLGVIVAIQDPEHASDHLTAWFRLFAQTPAFMLLFDSPDALASLCELLKN